MAADAPSPWAAERVNAAIENNLVPLHLQSNYTQPITRAEFSALAVALYESFRGEIIGRRRFTDTDDINVRKAAYIGVTFGGEGQRPGRFEPDETVARQDIAMTLERLAGQINVPLLNLEEDIDFADRDEMREWLVRSISNVVTSGIMSGVGNNAFAPRQLLTREQSIVTIMRLYDMASNVELDFDLNLYSPIDETGRVTLVADGVVHLSWRHFLGGGGRIESGDLVSVSGISFPSWLEYYVETLPEIQHSSDLKIIVEDRIGQEIGYNSYINVRFDDPDLYWLEELYEELLGDIRIIGVGAEHFENGIADISSLIPDEAGTYLVFVGLWWSSEDEEEHSDDNYFFKVVR